MRSWGNFHDALVLDGHEITTILRSGNLVWEEGMRDGCWVSLAWNVSGSVMEINPLPEPAYMPWRRFARPQSFGLEIDGQRLESHWQYVGADIHRCENETQLRVDLRHTIRNIEVTVCTRLDGGPVVERWIEVENTGVAPAAVSHYAPLSGGLQVLPRVMDTAIFQVGDHESIWKLGYFADDEWAQEGNYTVRPLPDGLYAFEGRYGRERYRHPMFTLENRLTGEMFVAQLAWSGGYRFSFDYNANGLNESSLWVNAALEVPAPLRVLEPGERWIGPAIHIGAVFGGLDEAINAMHGHVRRILLPKQAGARELIESGIGPEYDMSRESTLLAIECASDLGAELFYVDAGWYTPPGEETDWHSRVGDWHFDRERYPNGLDEIREACRARGMRFGLWMEPERIGIKSNEAKAHPEWIQRRYSGKPHETGLLDLGIDACARWVEAEIERVITEYRLDFLRIDWNVSGAGAINCRETKGYVENTASKYFDNLYGIFRRLRSRFPEVIFENCAGGGGRTDLGMAVLFNHTWVTDWQVHPNAFRITNGMTMALPPEHIDRLSFGQNGFITADLHTQLRNQLFTHMSIGIVTPEGMRPNEAQISIIRRYVDLYKQFVRPMLPESRIFHHTLELGGHYAQGTGILELASRDGDRSMIGVFQLSEPERHEIVIRPRGLCVSWNYRVYFDNEGGGFAISGGALMHRGLSVRCEGALTSELVLIEREDGNLLKSIYP